MTLARTAQRKQRAREGTWVVTTQEAPWQERPLVTGGAAETNLTIIGHRFQKWEGFGGCFNELGWLALGRLDAGNRKKVMKALFDPVDGCRFNLCRLPIGASDYAAEWYSHNEADGDFAMKHFSIQRDLTILIPYIKAALALRP
jgi:glucosylceramidase